MTLAALGRGGIIDIIIVTASLVTGILGVYPLLVSAGGGAVGYGAWFVIHARRSRREGNGRLASVLPWLAALHAPVMTTGLVPLGLTFLKIGAVAFGSGYVLLPFLHADFVGGAFHLTERQVADGFAISQVTPGPVFAVAAFLGVQIAGIPGGVVAAVTIFVPSLVYAPLVNVVMRVTEAHPGVRAALDAVVVAAVGLIASACVTLARASFVSPIEVATAVLVFCVLWRWPRAQPLGVGIGILAGLLVIATMH